MSRGHFHIALNATLHIEGGYSDDPNDSGGKTRYGITEAVARAHGYDGDMRELPFETAVAIAKQAYWDELSLDTVAPLAPEIAYELFDSGYNCGVPTAGKWLQRCLNVLNRRGTVFPDLVVDGRVGPATVLALKKHVEHRKGYSVLLRMLNSLQGAFYIGLAEARSKDEENVYGWFDHRVII